MACHSPTAHETCIAAALTRAEAHCAAKSLRFTDLRRKVFQLLWNSHKALTAADIMDVLGRSQPPLTYRALEFLKDQQLIHYIASLNAYVGCTHAGAASGENVQAHVSQLFVCETCREVAELPGDATAHTLKIGAQNRGFQVRQTFIEVLGRCRACAA